MFRADTQKEISQCIPACYRCLIVGIIAGEVKKSPGCGHLIEIPLLAAEIHAEFQRVLSPYPGDRICRLKNVLKDMFRKKFRVSQRREAGDIDIRQAG